MAQSGHPGGMAARRVAWRALSDAAPGCRGLVTGAVIDVPARVLARLAAYEGPAYRLKRVVVATPNGKTAAHTWIAPAATRRPWQAKGS